MRAFIAYGHTLNMVRSLEYLGKVLLAVDENWLAVIWNLVNTRTVCSRTTKTLSREGVRPRESWFFSKAVVQSVLLFGAEIWMVTPCIGRVMGGFQDNIVREMGVHLGGGGKRGGGV